MLNSNFMVRWPLESWLLLIASIVFHSYLVHTIVGQIYLTRQIPVIVCASSQDTAYPVEFQNKPTVAPEE